MFRVLTIASDGRVAESTDPVAPPMEGELRWVDLQAQDAPQMAVLAKNFGFHPLAIEDCLQVGQRPKLEEYDDYIFMVTHALRCLNGEDPRELQPEELHTFLGTSYIVTVHLGPIGKLETVWARAKSEVSLARHGVDFLYYLMADGIVDSHYLHLDGINEQLEALEDSILEKSQQKDLQTIFTFKHTLAHMRRILSPQRDVFAVLSRRGGDARISERTALYFRDVYDHLVRINESIDSARDLLGASLEAYLSMVSQRTNDIMKSLTLLSAVFLPLTFVTGFFGQNFAGLPMTNMHLMWAVIAACAIIPAVMIYWFRKRRWL